MTPKQRVILTQLQLTGAGFIFLGFGIAWTRTWLIIFGISLSLYSLARLLLLKKLMEQAQELDNKPQKQSVKQSMQDLEEDQEGEYAKDEWESKLESYLERHYDKKHHDLYQEQINGKTKDE